MVCRSQRPDRNGGGDQSGDSIYISSVGRLEGREDVGHVEGL